MKRSWILLCCLFLMGILVRATIAQDCAKAEKSTSDTPSARIAAASSTATHDSASKLPAGGAASDERIARVEGEKRFRTNCGRCHMPPHKFPPRVIATAIRHMRVRAMITDEDMRLILKYMTE